MGDNKVNMMDYNKELEEIGELILSASLLQSIRKEVAMVMREGFIVTDGTHHPLGIGYDVVVKCGVHDRPDVTRRIRGKIADIRVEKIAEGVLGIKRARRSR